jgi:hypothetical protein
MFPNKKKVQFLFVEKAADNQKRKTPLDVEGGSFPANITMWIVCISTLQLFHYDIKECGKQTMTFQNHRKSRI